MQAFWKGLTCNSQQEVWFDFAKGPTLLILNGIRQLSLYCLVDEVLRRGEITPGEKKNFIIFFPPTRVKM